ncbi:3-keto-5-aminohexanoate cleavage protein [Streptomyces rapamycinicus]|nr:3-keto-5-aminohexanoate cleavage protein [Streptomyces rapamycinicus]
MSPHLPITPDEIAQASIEAVRAGAAIVHLHARDPQTGKPDPRPELFQRFLPRISAETDAVVNISTGGARGSTTSGNTTGSPTSSSRRATWSSRTPSPISSTS